MPLYRVIENLRRNVTLIPAGSLITAEGWKEADIAALVVGGAVSKIAGPPLELLPGWERRGKFLAEKYGIEDAVQFLDTDDKFLSEELHVSVEAVQRYKKEVMRWLVVSKTD